MPPPPTRREQLELDELLSDIYRGIEALPDKSHNNASSSGTYGIYQKLNKSSTGPDSSRLIGRTHVKEYELPASSPLVKQHLAGLRQDLPTTEPPSQYPNSGQVNSNSLSNKQPQRSTLKRSTTNNTLDNYNSSRAAPQSLASFVTSTPTPENKRRVRIVDHPESFARRNNHLEEEDDADYATNYYAAQENDRQRRPEKVKYVNTNKLIYHQERNPDDQSSPEDSSRIRQANEKENGDDDDDEDDFDGKTRVEYYHTSWLDRQLGRASKRRSSKELNERQVKEKAMIEELKRSLKSGAITLRQSLRGKKTHNNKHSSDKSNNFTDDYQIDSSLDSHPHHQSHSSPSRHYNHKSDAIGSGLATIPRNHNRYNYLSATPVPYDTWVNKTRGSNSPKSTPDRQHSSANQYSSTGPSVARERQAPLEPPSRVIAIEEPRNSYYSPSSSQHQPTTPKQTSSGSNFLLANNNNNSNNINHYNSSTLSNRMLPQYQTRQPAEQPGTTSNLYSRTLPHKSRRGEHSLIESHLRGNGGAQNYTTLDRRAEPVNSSSTLPYSSSPSSTAAAAAASRAAARETPTAINSMRNPGYASPAAGLRSPNQFCGEQHQLRQRPGGDTVNNIPSATEVVRSALSRSSSQVSLNQLNKTINLLPNSPPPYSPSPAGQTPTQQLRTLSPGLSPSPAGPNCIRPAHTESTTPDRTPQRLYGSRTLDRNTKVGQQQQQAAPIRQPIYANPHASLMQHKAEQQARQPTRNATSIREFNELDNLLRSLSPATSQYQSSAHITPGFSSKPAQSSIGGYGFTAPSAAPAPVAATGRPTVTGNELYARVQKPAGNSIYQTQAADQTKASYLQQNYALANQQQHQPYTIDVTNKRADEDCYKRQDLSEFEAPIELLPSMEDYQNITKLNPVKNHYWYKPNMGRDRAINLLKDKPQGTFIVRDSTSFRGAYGLALKVAKLPKNVLNNVNLRNFSANDPSAELIRHFLIEPTQSGVRLKGYENEPVFNSLPDLIYQHSLTELALPCRLIIPRADIEDPNFNLKQKQFFDDFVASKEQAKHLPYERTSPDGGYRKYPGDVYVHNEHRIIFE